MRAIFKKELKTYFTSVVGCLFIAITLLIIGGFFTLYNLSHGTPYILYAVSNCMLVLVFTIPILTMRILADEQKQKTDQLILTAPVSVGKIVMGKYLALATIYVIPILVMCVYPLIMTRFGEVPLKMTYTTILGMLLYGLAFIAIGTFISSITESQVIAAILSVVVLFIGYMMQNITNVISAEGNVVTKILKVFDIFTPSQDFLNGIIDLTSVVYYISIIVLFLFFTVQSIQKRKWTMSRNTISTGVFSTTFIVVAVIIAVFSNLIAGKLEETVEWASVDMTDQNLYTISDDTLKLLAGVEDDLKFYVLVDKASSDITVDETLKRYERACDKITIEYKDVVKYPNFYKTYSETAPELNSVIVVNETSGKSKVVNYGSMYKTEMDYATYTQTTTGYDAEGQLTSAINYVTSSDNPVIFSVTGHGEVGMGQSFVDAIEKMNIQIEEINLLDHQVITTEKCDMMMLLSPMKDYSKDDADKVMAYLKAGGKVLMTTAYGEEELKNYNSIAECYGVKVLDGVVAENDASHSYQSPFGVLAADGSGFATGLSNYLLFGYPQGMYIDKDSKNYRDTIEYVQMVSTTDKAVCKMDLNNAVEYTMEKGDVEGPFDLGISLAEAVTDEETGEMTVTELTIVASSSVFSDEYDTVVSGANLELFKNIINGYVETDGEIVSIPVKTTMYSNLVVPEMAFGLIGMLVSFILPLGVLGIGIIVWAQRRKK